MKYLDTNVIGYAIEDHSKYGNSCKKILGDVQSEKIKVCCSILVLVELINTIKKINKELKRVGRKELEIRANIDAVLSLPIQWVEMEMFIIKRAAEYNYNINGADYIHIATMEVNGVYEILSADADFDVPQHIIRIDPLDY